MNRAVLLPSLAWLDFKVFWAVVWAAVWAVVWAAGWLAWPGVAAATFYQWTTPDGVIGLTDDPGRIPAQYRTTAKAYESPGVAPYSIQPEANAGQPSPSPPDSASDSSMTGAVDQNGHDRAWWQARVQELKSQRTELVNQQEQAQKKFNEIQYFGRQTYGELHETQLLREQIDDMTGQIKEIDQQLTSDLPNEARQAGAPLGWVRN
jgi:hypothetical protein